MHGRTYWRQTVPDSRHPSFSQQCYSHYPAHLSSGNMSRPYPAVDTTVFTESVHLTQELVEESRLLLDELAASEPFARQIMGAAQESNTEEVQRLIKTTGITADVDTSYTPDGIRLEFRSPENEISCCRLQVTLRW